MLAPTEVRDVLPHHHVIEFERLRFDRDGRTVPAHGTPQRGKFGSSRGTTCISGTKLDG
jgi:hypothetical protein